MEKSSVWKLPEEDYQRWSRSAVGYGASEDEQLAAIRYFLPRVALDFALTNDSPIYEERFTTIMNALEWKTWQERERDAIETWFCAWIRHQLSQADSWFHRDSTRCAAMCGIDLSKFFHEYREADRQQSVIWLANTIQDNWQAALQTGWPAGWHSYWLGKDPPTDYAIRFFTFLLRRSSRGILEAAFFEFDDAENQALISAAHKHQEDCLRFGNLVEGSPLTLALRDVQRMEK